MEDQNFQESFDPKAYYQDYYTEVSPKRKQTLKVLHELYSSYGPSPSGLKVLDYGCGPVVVYGISAALQDSEIVMADYVEKNQTGTVPDLWTLSRSRKALLFVPDVGQTVKNSITTYSLCCICTAQMLQWHSNLSRTAL